MCGTSISTVAHTIILINSKFCIVVSTDIIVDVVVAAEIILT